MTLPLIHTLNEATARERRRLIRLVKHHNHKDQAVQEVMDAIIGGPGMDYARKKMTELRDEAMALLDAEQDSDAKEALIGLVDFTIERKR